MTQMAASTINQPEVNKLIIDWDLIWALQVNYPLLHFIHYAGIAPPNIEGVAAILRQNHIYGFDQFLPANDGWPN
ncbi:hypothetical protein CROQUDRAFT_97105 [Cronartium quercuum f. sp. fusiforme G11]|uniref:Uncharacterized protein n=1 Tax=Cronartium quercuum f. sp. fusiforme G11 TaxID=708437 RepID=A0A9P6NBZ8_9BASI|nr:hypothetical protein CROQUDRAFT_97105 [Cronartium quercuum f. sp. fusiforme G11]